FSKKVHIDIDPSSINKVIRVDVPIVGDARHVIAELLTAVTAERAAGRAADIADWWTQLDDLRERYPLGYEEPSDGTLSPQYVIERLGEIAGPDAIYVAG
ncbi:acetolactate synthase large subunit, partial [Escherichia coli]|nr:acetolactate synthase large subunit [Escherichia coli]